MGAPVGAIRNRGATHPRYHPRPTLQPYHGKKKLPQEKGKTDPAIRVAIRQRFPAIWNRKRPSALLLFCAFPKQGNSATRPPAIRVAIRKRHPAIRKHVFGNSAARCMPKNVGISVIRPAIRVAIREQFTAIRDGFRQFGCSAHAQNVGNSAIRSPHSSPFKILKRERGQNTHGCTAPGATILEFYHTKLWRPGVMGF